MFCRKCGTQLSSDAVFCSQCGCKVLEQPDSGKEKIFDLFEHGNISPKTSSEGNLGGWILDELCKIGVALVVDMYQESHLTSKIIADVKSVLASNPNCYVKGNIPKEYFDNAVRAYAGEFGIKLSDVCLLYDDTVLVDKGSVGFMVTDGRIITSRKQKFSFGDIDKIYLNGNDIMVRTTKGDVVTVYTVDLAADGLQDLFSRISKKLAEIRAERDENITNNPNFKL